MLLEGVQFTWKKPQQTGIGQLYTRISFLLVISREEANQVTQRMIRPMRITAQRIIKVNIHAGNLALLSATRSEPFFGVAGEVLSSESNFAFSFRASSFVRWMFVLLSSPGIVLCWVSPFHLFSGKDTDVWINPTLGSSELVAWTGVIACEYTATGNGRTQSRTSPRNSNLQTFFLALKHISSYLQWHTHALYPTSGHAKNKLAIVGCGNLPLTWQWNISDEAEVEFLQFDVLLWHSFNPCPATEELSRKNMRVLHDDALLPELWPVLKDARTSVWKETKLQNAYPQVCCHW